MDNKYQDISNCRSTNFSTGTKPRPFFNDVKDDRTWEEKIREEMQSYSSKIYISDSVENLDDLQIEDLKSTIKKSKTVALNDFELKNMLNTSNSPVIKN